MDKKHRRIPPVFVDPEPPETLPEAAAFSNKPVEVIQIGDLVRLNGQVWRVMNRVTSRTSPRIGFVFWPVMGGRPMRTQFFPREWLYCVHDGHNRA